ncbi:hypothetical protein [Nocardioides mesophilus]|uniref:Uncharacterized protein n=1 Tax=Nocardioides mesophilus TaxID=433659 RepID=A0A7G9RF60_9ACTN|nr:hypothetical protein [Nocardioides mesophilus]QNN54235.1 hypothetical protein H9L09_07800 [Nocardioides mesophilus]
MSEFSGYYDRLAEQQIRERVASRRTVSQMRRPRGRHALADRLHHLADRIDG